MTAAFFGAVPASAVADGMAGAEARHSLRAPVTDETFCFVMADRFENGSTANDLGGLPADRMVSGFDPKARGFHHGGDLKGILERIDYIRGLGTTSIWLTPSFKDKAVQREDDSAGYHGYRITDFTQIDPHLGSNEDLRALVDAAHARGMKVYFDIITNHTADVIRYEQGARPAYVSKDVFPYRDASGTAFDDRDFAGTDSFPPLDAGNEIALKDDTKPVNFIMHTPGGDSVPSTREPGGDRSFAPLDASEIWLVQGDPAVHTSKP